MEEPQGPTWHRYALGFLWLLGLQAATGLVLAFTYRAAPALAHASVTGIHEGTSWWVRSLHAWSADALLIVGIVLGTNLFLRRAPVLAWRPWLGGIAVLGALTAAHLTGGILTWDQQGWESYQHVTATVPLGPSPRLDAVAAAHLMAFVAAVAVPAWLVGQELVRAARHELVALVTTWPALAVTTLLAFLALLSPPALGPAPIDGLFVSRPDWPFLWLTPLQDAFGPRAVWALPALFAALAASPPLLRRATPRARIWVAVAAVLFLGVLTAVGLLD